LVSSIVPLRIARRVGTERRLRRWVLSCVTRRPHGAKCHGRKPSPPRPDASVRGTLLATALSMANHAPSLGRGAKLPNGRGGKPVVRKRPSGAEPREAPADVVERLIRGESQSLGRLRRIASRPDLGEMRATVCQCLRLHERSMLRLEGLRHRSPATLADSSLEHGASEVIVVTDEDILGEIGPT
jgi:hypothetical protein